jgi:hypothetical protein
MAKIFISYRRGDTKWIIGRLNDRLERWFGKSWTFMDVEDVPPGIAFGEHIESVIRGARVFLAVIGPQWRTGNNPDQPRLFERDDWVRIEIEKALEKHIPIIPVLIDDELMPRGEDLPPSLRALPNFHGIRVDSERDFNVHVKRLIRGIEKRLGWRAIFGRRRLFNRVTPTVLLIAVAAAAISWHGSPVEEDDVRRETVQAAVLVCRATFNISCAQQGGIYGARDTLAGLGNCRTPTIIRSDDPSLHWKDVWTTSIYSFAPGGGGPGGGLDDDQLKVGGWGDWYFSLIQFDLPTLQAVPKFAAIALYSKRDASASQPLSFDRIIQAWDFPKGGRLWWKDRPGAQAVSADLLPAPIQEQWYAIDLTSLIGGWRDGTIPNYGVQIRPTSNYGSHVVFVSSDAADKSKIPRLIFCT